MRQREISRTSKEREVHREGWAGRDEVGYKVHVTGCGEALEGPYYFGRAYEAPPDFTWSGTSLQFPGAAGSAPEAFTVANLRPTYHFLDFGLDPDSDTFWGFAGDAGPGSGDGDSAAAQRISVPVNGSIDQVRVRLRKIGTTGAGSVWVDVIAGGLTDGGDLSVGVVASSNTIDISTVTNPSLTHGADLDAILPMKSFTFANPYVAGTEPVFLVVRTDVPGPGSLLVRATPATYATGLPDQLWMHSDEFDEWRHEPDWALEFEVSGSSSVPATPSTNPIPPLLTVGVERWIQDSQGMYVGAHLWFKTRTGPGVGCSEAHVCTTGNLLSDPGFENHLANTEAENWGNAIPWDNNRIGGHESARLLVWPDPDNPIDEFEWPFVSESDQSGWCVPFSGSQEAFQNKWVVSNASPRTGQYHARYSPPEPGWGMPHIAPFLQYTCNPMIEFGGQNRYQAYSLIVKPGDEVTYSVWAKATDVSLNPELAMQWWFQNEYYRGAGLFSDDDVLLTTDYQQISFTATAPQGAKYAIAILEPSNPSSNIVPPGEFVDLDDGEMYIVCNGCEEPEVIGANVLRDPGFENTTEIVKVQGFGTGNPTSVFQWGDLPGSPSDYDNNAWFMIEYEANDHWEVSTSNPDTGLKHARAIQTDTRHALCPLGVVTCGSNHPYSAVVQAGDIVTWSFRARRQLDGLSIFTRLICFDSTRNNPVLVQDWSTELCNSTYTDIPPLSLTVPQNGRYVVAMVFSDGGTGTYDVDNAVLEIVRP